MFPSIITSTFCSKDRLDCASGFQDATVHGTWVLNLFSDELTKNKAAGSQREANLMKKCEHYFCNFSKLIILFLVNNDNIVRLIDVFECDGKLHLIMEYCQGGDLRALIRKKLHEEEYFSYSQVKIWIH